ncbi:hypothetical protein Pst134EA_000983 [Puccinia striiformis f. sp. tritici]|uniref:hypothetical protein n=1 Tax=Puccinia striiformis f. sp. tritici TaxID=168172 RepID=UPI00200872BC|nr:hypothetical protein Pst134EA_000983 [Puccinia striiformis f. sp. tritici]KAH9473927.1 hypothetical protein Pst134EA_000983 [Puccinia striiformis f. sp. tritici]
MLSYNLDTVWRLSLFLMILDLTTSSMIRARNVVTEAATSPQVVGEGLLEGLDHGYNSGTIISPPRYNMKDMKFKNLGRWGLRVPIFSYGGSLSVGSVANGAAVKELMPVAWDHGCNYFDNAEGYANGNSEIEMGKAFKELGWKRSEYMVATKVFFGTGDSKEPNARGLSRKHIIEGVTDSLKRLQLRYVDVVHAHRPDPTVPIEETVRAFDFLINQGLAHYWGTSEWSAQQIQEAITVARTCNLNPPVLEQPQYSLLNRERFEVEYNPIFKNLGHGSTIWSPLKDGILTGKYNDGIPAGSRMDVNKEYLKTSVNRLLGQEGQEEIKKVKKLTQLAKEKLNCSVAQLALAWAASNPHVSTVILGATKPEQLRENFGALKVIDKLTPEIMEEIESIVANKPIHPKNWGILQPLMKWIKKMISIMH